MRQIQTVCLLFKGLGPNLVGVAPSRAVYFCTYSQAKQFWNNLLPPDSPIVHVCSASCAGFMASTLTNPIWFVKTRLQLDFNKENQMTAMQCVRRIYSTSVSFHLFAVKPVESILCYFLRVFWDSIKESLHPTWVYQKQSSIL